MASSDLLASPRRTAGVVSPSASPSSVAAALVASEFADDFEHDTDIVAPKASEIHEGEAPSETISKLRKECDELRDLLNASLARQRARPLAGVAGKDRKPRPEELRHSTTVAEQELQNSIKRMEIYKKANEVLRKQINSSLNPERLASLTNEMADKDKQLARLIDENKTLKAELRRKDKEIEADGNSEWPVKMNALMEELRAAKEKVRLFTERHNKDEKSARAQQDKLVALEMKNRKLVQAASQSTKKPKADTFDSKGDDISSISSYQQTIEDLKQQLRERDAELRLHSAHGRLSRKGSSHSTSSEPSMQGGVAGTIDSARRSITGEKKLTKKPSAKQAPRTLAKLENQSFTNGSNGHAAKPPAASRAKKQLGSTPSTSSANGTESSAKKAAAGGRGAKVEKKLAASSSTASAVAAAAAVDHNDDNGINDDNTMESSPIATPRDDTSVSIPVSPATVAAAADPWANLNAAANIATTTATATTSGLTMSATHNHTGSSSGHAVLSPQPPPSSAPRSPARPAHTAIVLSPSSFSAATNTNTNTTANANIASSSSAVTSSFASFFPSMTPGVSSANDTSSSSSSSQPVSNNLTFSGAPAASSPASSSLTVGPTSSAAVVSLGSLIDLKPAVADDDYAEDFAQSEELTL